MSFIFLFICEKFGRKAYGSVNIVFFLHVIQSQLVEKETEFQYPKDSFCPESTEIAVHSWFSCLE
jgi:uncharacterized sporulation protein YeaH/YhbH (DUF444 family)